MKNLLQKGRHFSVRQSQNALQQAQWENKLREMLIVNIKHEEKALTKKPN